MKFTIDRRTWRRGDDAQDVDVWGDTALRNDEGNQCCLGFVCQQLGVGKNDLTGVALPSTLHDDQIDADVLRKVREMFLVTDEKSDDFMEANQLENSAVEINDDSDIDDAEREQLLRQLFNLEGHQIEFIN